MPDRQRMIAGLLQDADKALASLTREEKQSLRKLAPATLKGAIPKKHEDTLVALELVERKLGCLTLTPIGEVAAKKVSHW